MPAPLTHITPTTPMGANLLLPDGSGATFRVWAPRALRVHLISEHSDWTPKGENFLTRDANGYWAGFWPGFKDGSRYKFHVFGPGGDDPKRDPLRPRTQQSARLARSRLPRARPAPLPLARCRVAHTAVP